MASPLNLLSEDQTQTPPETPPQARSRPNALRLLDETPVGDPARPRQKTAPTTQPTTARQAPSLPPDMESFTVDLAGTIASLGDFTSEIEREPTDVADALVQRAARNTVGRQLVQALQSGAGVPAEIGQAVGQRVQTLRTMMDQFRKEVEGGDS